MDLATVTNGERQRRMNHIRKAKKILTIGGGTGTYTVLSGLKKYPEHMVEPVAVVSMADSGGSTGRLRDQFGYLPVGDVRMALVALAGETDNPLLRQLFLHRFDKGEGISGHNFGNLLLVALTDILGSEEAAIEAAGRILRIAGKVLPVTTENVNLVAKYSDGSVVEGEGYIDDECESDNPPAIIDVWLTPEAQLNPRVAEEISTADMVVLGPGDLYTSILPNVVVNGMPEALKETPAILVYVSNLMTKHGQTDGLSAMEHAAILSEYIGRLPDVILQNNAPYPEDLLKLYESEREFPVRDDLTEEDKVRVIRADFISDVPVEQAKGDVLRRSLLRHDSDKLAKAIMNLLDE